MTIRMAYEMVMPYHLHMPSYFLETFTEYPYLNKWQCEHFIAATLKKLVLFIAMNNLLLFL